MTTTAQAGAQAPPAAGRRRRPPLPPIEHGTAKGYRQHRARGVPYCEECTDAIRDENQAGVKPTGRNCPAVGSGCGELATAPQPAAHMVIVSVDGSREPARWYCAGGCAAYGQALAEIRAL